jgi:hypothetical protein
MRFSQYAQFARLLTASAFAARVLDPVLVPLGSGYDDATSDDTPDGGPVLARRAPRSRDAGDDSSLEWARSTHGDEGMVAEATPPRVSLGDPELTSIVKTERNPFRQMITVGRSLNNDIVLIDRTVSKVHAHFIVSNRRYRLHDQPSRNGTYVDGARISLMGTELIDGARITFGSRLSFRFYTPAGLHRILTAG